jgi:hexulose-6-phosphate isomerase
MAKLGIMEGRLVPPEAGKFQSFPRGRWAEEFDLARQVPVSYIEWIYDGYGADVNPLIHDPTKLLSHIAASGVTVRSICADYFMEFPFVRCSEPERLERWRMLLQLMELAQQVGAARIVIPFVDASEIVTSQEAETVARLLNDAVAVAHETGVELHLETSLDPHEFRALLDRVPDHMIRVNYDIGNSASLGFRAREEIAAYGERIGSVHVKDRKFGSGTVPLGTGDADFSAIFQGLAQIEYSGDFTLQVARSSAGDEVAWAKENRSFVTRYWPLE